MEGPPRAWGADNRNSGAKPIPGGPAPSGPVVTQGCGIPLIAPAGRLRQGMARYPEFVMIALPVPVLTIGLLIASNVFMTFAWYGHLRFKARAARGW